MFFILISLVFNSDLVLPLTATDDNKVPEHHRTVYNNLLLNVDFKENPMFMRVKQVSKNYGQAV